MPAFASITINDGATTPLAHVFGPVTITRDGVEAQFADRAAGIPLGYNDLSIAVREPTANGTVFKHSVVLEMPVLEAATGPNAQGFTPAPQLAFTCTARVEMLLPTRSSVQNRKDLHTLIANLFANANFKSSIENLENYH